MIGRQGEEILSSSLVRWRLVFVALATVIHLAAGGASEAQFTFDPDPGNPEPALVKSEGELYLVADTLISGNVHTNGTLVVEAGAVVDGDASAVKSAQIDGSVTGTVTSPASYQELPKQITALVARDIADQIWEADHDFFNATITGTIYVEGTARFFGTLDGSGMVIASGDIEVSLLPSATPGQPVPAMDVSLSAYRSITILDSRAFRGSLDAGTDITFATASWMMGSVLARGTVRTAPGVKVVEMVDDIEPPAVDDLTPADLSWINSLTPTLSASFSDDLAGVDPASVHVLLDGIEVAPDAVSETGFSFVPSVPLSERLHLVEVLVSDQAGNETPRSWIFGVDVSAPVLSFNSPAADLLSVDTAVEAVALYEDAASGVDSTTVEVELDGEPLACDPVPNLVRCEFVLASSGSHVLDAHVTDRAGNTAEITHPFQFRLDLAPPVVTVTSPSDGALVVSATLEVSGSVVDDGLVAELEVNGDPVELNGSEFAHQVSLEPGVNPVLIVATDTFGRQGYVSLSVTLDPVPPVVTLSRPVEGELTNQPALRVEGVAEDDNGLGSVTVNGQPVTIGSGGEFEASLTIAPGTNLVTVHATDQVGNTTEVIRSVVYVDVPTVAITSPLDLAELATTSIDVAGTASEEVLSVEVNGVAAQLSDNSFLASGVPLVEGGNIVTATATSASGLQGTDSVHVVRDLTPPRVVIEHPIDGAIVDEPVVTVWGLVNDIVAGTVNASEVSVEVNGSAAEVGNRSFRLAGVPLAPGANTVSVTATDAAGNTAQATVEVQLATAPVARVRVVSGDGQTATVGEPLADPLVVEVLDGGGQPVAGETVLFKVKGGDGFFAGGARRIAVETDAAGRAQTAFTLGHRAGPGNQRVEALAVGYAGPAMFSMIATPGPRLRDPARRRKPAGGCHRAGASAAAHRRRDGRWSQSSRGCPRELHHCQGRRSVPERRDDDHRGDRLGRSSDHPLRSRSG